jgi:formylglycine-generating enzyme required for sulfatase activity
VPIIGYAGSRATETVDSRVEVVRRPPDASRLASEARQQVGELVMRIIISTIALLVVALVSQANTASLSASSSLPLSNGEESLLKPNDTFKECDDCPEMVVISTGSFTMGSPESEHVRSEDEGPEHLVTFEQTFSVGKFAVTFDDWDACVADGGCNAYWPDDHGWGRGRLPVINVSWDDANAYVRWLSRKTGKTYRLLSEAEREYVTRAGSTTPFWWGVTISPQHANYNGNNAYGDGPVGENRARTLPVDSFQSNPWGVYQVHGNVNEWTQDCWHYDYVGAPSDGSPWISGDCEFRVSRGGSWYSFPASLRAARRNRDLTELRSIFIGFRVARTLTPSSSTR